MGWDNHGQGATVLKALCTENVQLMLESFMEIDTILMHLDHLGRLFSPDRHFSWLKHLETHPPTNPNPTAEASKNNLRQLAHLCLLPQLLPFLLTPSLSSQAAPLPLSQDLSLSGHPVSFRTRSTPASADLPAHHAVPCNTGSTAHPAGYGVFLF